MEEEEGVEGEGMDNNNKKMSSKPSNWFLESVVSFQETWRFATAVADGAVCHWCQ